MRIEALGLGVCLGACAVMPATCGPATAQAHPLRFGVLTIDMHAEGGHRVVFRYSGTETAPVGAQPTFPLFCAARSLSRGDDVSEGSLQVYRLTCDRGLVGSQVGIEGLPPGVQILARARLPDGHVAQAVLTTGSPSFTIPSRASGLTTLREHLVLGAQHIVAGIDHLLFVLVLLMIVGFRWRIATTVTAFTLGHSLTLMLASLGWIHVPQAPVEACIALSIAWVAAEIVRARRTDLTITFPEIPAAGFGLLHGLGFAGALAETGLPDRGVVWALLGFNLGVELGQLAFVVTALLLYAAARRFRLPAGGGRAPQLAAYVVGSLAFLWAFERVAAF